jgi:hypothetical protein
MLTSRLSEWFKKRAPETIIGVITLGVVTNIVYDILIKPKMTAAWVSLGSFLSFGSKTIENSVYSSAALDPRPLTSLMILLGIASLPIPIVLDAISKLIIKSKKNNELPELFNKIKMLPDGDEKNSLKNDYFKIKERYNRRRKFGTIVGMLPAALFDVHLWCKFAQSIDINLASV